MRDYDEITSFLGEYGPFQILIFFILSASAIPTGYMGMSMVFLADTPDHHCNRFNGNSSGQHEPATGVSFQEISRRIGPDTCSRFKDVNNSNEALTRLGNDTEGCVDGWIFSTEMYTSTVVSEWELVCDNAWKVPLSTSVFFLGVLIGSLVSGQLSDRCGRKPVFFLTMLLQTVACLVQASSVSWLMYCILNCLRGMGQISTYISSLVLGSEILAGSTRASFTLLGHSLGFGLGYALLPLFAYFLRGWRMLLVVSALPGFLFLPLWWVIPESPRWLLLQGRREEAELVIRKAAKMNKVSAPEVVFKTDDCSELLWKNGCGSTEEPKYTFLDLLRTTDMRNITIINILLWAVIAMVFYGLSLNTANMNGNAYLNCLVSAVTEIAAYLATWFLIRRAPRPMILFGSLLFCGVTLLVIKLVPEDQQVASQVLAQLGKLGISGSYSFIYLFSMELYPTVVRNVGLGLASSTARIGSMLAPYVLYIGSYSRVLPYVIFGVISLLAAFLSLLLPDTRGCRLPDLISQVRPARCFSLKGAQTQEVQDVEQNGKMDSDV